MRILITGAEGMLGRRLCEEAESRGHLVLAHDQPRFRLEHPDEAAGLVRADHPELVIHAAAMTDVDACESQVDRAMRLNGEASGAIAEAAARVGASCIYISTDYVFDGKKPGPYLEDDATGPATAYGRSKQRGEAETRAHGASVLRLSWSFGPDGRNFAETVARKLRAGESLRVVDDQRGAPSYTRDTARAILDLGEGAHDGVYHCCNGGETCWYAFAREIARLMDLPAGRISPCSSEEFPRPAPRPANSLLGGRRLTDLRGPMPHWTDALARYLEETGWLNPPKI